MRNICFITNVDWFFHSHRRPLAMKLETIYNTSVIAGNSGFKVDYNIKTFQVRSRIPTLKGFFQLYNHIKKLNQNTTLIVVSPVMIILCHFLLIRRGMIFYNFSGLGFLRSLSPLKRNFIMYLMNVFPVFGERVFVVQNSDDYKFLRQKFKYNKKFHFEIVAGSGFDAVRENFSKSEFSEVTLGYVGRIRKDKGILDLARAVSELENEGYRISLKIWGNLDVSRRHGFSELELDELKRFSQYFQGFSEDKREIFSSFKWFCLPSNGEGLSKAAIEASSFGLPLILSNVEGNRDMIKGNGFLFQFGDTENLKTILRKIFDLSENEVQDMSETSRNMFEANWTLETIHNKWKQLLIKYDTVSS